MYQNNKTCCTQIVNIKIAKKLNMFKSKFLQYYFCSLFLERSGRGRLVHFIQTNKLNFNISLQY